MAMHKKLDVGSVLFCYHEPIYEYYAHRRNAGKYSIQFKVLYVHNRRERTTGARVPRKIVPTLDKLSIRYTDDYREEYVYAVGCRAATYKTYRSDLPYPTAEQIKEARASLEAMLETGELCNEGVRLMSIDFVDSFKEKKMSNKDSLFSLNKPLVDYQMQEKVI